MHLHSAAMLLLPGTAPQAQPARLALAGLLAWSALARLLTPGDCFALPPPVDCVRVVASLGAAAACLFACEERLCAGIAAAAMAMLRDRAIRYGLFLGDDWRENALQFQGLASEWCRQLATVLATLRRVVRRRTPSAGRTACVRPGLMAH